MIYAPHVLSKPNESPDLTAARARIAELEDWQRRAVRVMTNLWGARETRAYFANRLQDLIKEATR